MNVISLDLDKIDDSDRLRPVDMAWAKVIAESMRDQEQLEPIEVLPAGANGKYKLVIGAHRVAALRLNGEFSVDAKIFDGSADQARLREIDENLCRAELNDLDRAVFLGERKRLYELLHPPSRGGRPRGGKTVANDATVLRFTLETARTTKLAERTIRALVRRYRLLEPDVRDRLRGTWLASVGKELDAIAALKPAEQRKVVEVLLQEHDPQPTVALAKAAALGIKPKPKETADEQFSKLLAVWTKTGREARRRFREYLASPESQKEKRNG